MRERLQDVVSGFLTLFSQSGRLCWFGALLLTALTTGVSAQSDGLGPAGLGAGQGALGTGTGTSSGIERGNLPEEAQARLAMSTPDYPVTPGDVYVLTYIRSTGPVTQNLVVESDFTINLGVLGDFDATDLTFDEARTAIEERVRDAYTGSAPKVIIQRLGRFHVLLKGEVKQARFVTVTGLSRLGEVVEAHRTEYASVRRVQVSDRGGEVQSYDLFLARRDGEMDQNPYVRPGDEVTLHSAKRRVGISGEVRRPGNYQLVDGEGIDELVERYGDGFTGRAVTRRVRVVSLGGEPTEETRTVYADLSEPGSADVTLRDGDRVIVPTKLALRPVVYFEGALSDAPFFSIPEPIQAGTGDEEQSRSRPTTADEDDAIEDPDVKTARQYRTGRVAYRFQPGERLSSAVNALEERFLSTSNLENAVLVREGNAAPQLVDLEKMLRGVSDDDFLLRPGDRVVIPYEEFFVTVSGSVNNPGKYDYVPGRTYEYYLSLAGGVDRAEHWFGVHPRIRTNDGERKSRRAEIAPEDRIHFAANNPFRILTPIATTLGAVLSAIVTIQTLSN